MMVEPTAPLPPEIQPFPWLQSVIPIALSGFMASLLGQPLLLLMGALAPMMVAGGWWPVVGGSPEDMASYWNTLPEGVTVALDATTPLEARLASAGRIVLPPLAPPAHLLVLWDRGTFRLSQRVWRQD